MVTSSDTSFEEKKLAEVLFAIKRAEEFCDLGFFSSAKNYLRQAQQNIELLQAKAKLNRLTIKPH
jgi:hypothetical protein